MADFMDIFRRYTREHMRHRTANENTVFMAFLQFAGRDMTCYPTPGQVAEMTGIEVRNVKRIIHGLTELGYLVTAASGGGRGHAAIRQVACPSTPPDLVAPATETVVGATTLSGETVVNKTMVSPTTVSPETVVNPYRNSGKNAPETVVNSTTPTTYITTQLTTHTPPSPSAGLPAEAETQVRGFKHNPRNRTACVPIPASLRTADFEAAWMDYHVHRAEQGKPVTQLQARECLTEMSAWGPARAVAAIRHSLAKGFSGIFEDRASGKGPARDSPATPTRRPGSYQNAL
jgi:hypothetical protein